MIEFFTEKAKTKYGYKASLLDFSGASNIVIPGKIKDEIPTLNRHGFMKLDLDKFSKMFVKRASKVDYSMDIGCAYGLVVNKALESGAKVIAFDLDQDHLELLGSDTQTEYIDNLYLIKGEFPKDLSIENKLGSVLASRIMHFLDGEDFVIGLKKIYNALENKGKFYFTSVTPYHSAIKDGFLEEYKKRKANGVMWPGIIENQWLINPKHKEYVHSLLHVFDIPDLKMLLPKAGFKIEDISLFDYPNDTNSEGKGHVGFVATKV